MGHFHLQAFLSIQTKFGTKNCLLLHYCTHFMDCTSQFLLQIWALYLVNINKFHFPFMKYGYLLLLLIIILSCTLGRVTLLTMIIFLFFLCNLYVFQNFHARLVENKSWDHKDEIKFGYTNNLF